ncbi:MAG: hypothetical protein AAFX58_00290, partial [Pseudomonadota bacterium]
MKKQHQLVLSSVSACALVLSPLSHAVARALAGEARESLGGDAATVLSAVQRPGGAVPADSATVYSLAAHGVGYSLAGGSLAALPIGSRATAVTMTLQYEDDDIGGIDDDDIDDDAVEDLDDDLDDDLD